MYRDLGENISGGGKKGIRKKPVAMTNIGEQAGAAQVYNLHVFPALCGKFHFFFNPSLMVEEKLHNNLGEDLFYSVKHPFEQKL